jgi:hypothetical protein
VLERVYRDNAGALLGLPRGEDRRPARMVGTPQLQH